jgi:Family of unknown function (DUF6515)
MQYRYYQGVFYQPMNGGYVVIAPPVNAAVPGLPTGFSTVQVAGITYYYYGGVFYYLNQNGYQVVKAPAAAIVADLPDGCVPVQAGNITFLKFNNTYFQPIQFNGQNMYEVVEVE